jgi:hypothetical protein
MVVAGPRGGGAIPGLKAVALAACLLALFVLTSAPCANALLTGGPIIDGCVYGNKEYYPGQTAPLLVLVQNSGYLQSLYGYSTPAALLKQAGLSFSSGGNFSSSSSGYQSSGYQATAGTGALTGAAEAIGTSISQTTGSTYYNYYQTGALGDLEVNTAPTVPLEATTALGLTCQLIPADAPVTIVSGDRMLVGSLPAGAVGGGPTGYGGFALNFFQPMQFWIRISPDAKPGHYLLPLVCTYKQLADDYDYTSVFGPVLGYSNYIEVTDIILLDIVIMPRFDLVISDTVCTDMVPGTDGIITMTVWNFGSMPVDHAVAFLMLPTLGAPQDEVNYPLNYQLLSYQAYYAGQPEPVTQNMVVPVQNSQYLGRMEPGESRTVKFKVSISDYAEEGDFPLSAVVSYNDPWDEQRSSNVDTFGVHVEPEMRFDVDPGPVEIKCGRSCIANLTLTNNGTRPARDAIVRMNALDPFTVSYDTMYLGDVAPGKNESTRFGIKVKPDAVPGEYYVTLEVKYYDARDDPHVTRIIRKAIVVLPPPTLLDTITENWPLALGFALLVLLGIAYMGYKWLAKRRKPPAAGTMPPEGTGRLITDGAMDDDKNDK